MKKKALALAIASVLATPAALAARDPDGMSYTSSSEGLSGNSEVRWNSRTDATSNTKGGFHYRGDFSISGNIEIQPGLTGTYNLGIRDNTEFDTSNRVGLKGAFGEVTFGDGNSVHDFVTDTTDTANANSGNFGNDQFGGGDYSLLYTSPDLNGFQFGVELQSQEYGTSSRYASNSYTVEDGIAGAAGQKVLSATASTKPDNGDDKESLDTWGVSAKYGFSGFSIQGAYTSQKEGLRGYNVPAQVVITGAKASNDNVEVGKNAVSVPASAKGTDDRASWLVGASYGQDNWNIAGWYGERDEQGVKIKSAQGAANSNTVTAANAGSVHFLNESSEYLSLAGDISVERFKFYINYDGVDNFGGQKGVEKSWTTFGAQYNLSAQTRAWVEYVSRDDDTATNEKDWFQVALKYYF